MPAQSNRLGHSTVRDWCWKWVIKPRRPDMEQKSFCFEDGTLCAAAQGCRAELQSERHRMHQSGGKKRKIPLLSPFHAHQKYSLWTVIAVQNVAQGFCLIKGFYVFLCYDFVLCPNFSPGFPYSEPHLVRDILNHFKTSDLFIIPPTWSMVPKHLRGIFRHM